jgi:hypothetical protein
MVPVLFEDEAQWEFKDTDRVVLLLDSETKRVRAAANLADFVHLTVKDGDGE